MHRVFSPQQYQRLLLVNVFAYRSTHPRELRQTENPVGSLNKRYILQAAASAEQIIVGWGNHGALRGQDRELLAWLTP